MQNIFKQLDKKNKDQLYTGKIGRVTSVSGNTADVQINGLPLLLNLPIVFPVNAESRQHEIRSGMRVYVSFIDSDINQGVILGFL